MTEVKGVTVVREHGEQSIEGEFIPCIPGSTSDGYHTFDELYEHRCLLFAALLKVLWYQYEIGCFKSKKHHDGSEWNGWFIAGVKAVNSSPETQQITYHLPLSIWDLVDVPEYSTAPEWDGHTSQDVIERLKQLIKAL